MKTRTAIAALLAALPLLAGGCAILGFAAAVVPDAPVPPAYKGLAGQSVGVMVWADRQTYLDFAALQLDLANTIQNRLVNEQTKNKRAELKDSTFPVQPASILRYQREHPEVEALPIVQVAPNLNVTRLIYIEIEDFATRPDAALELYRGSLVATIRVLEINGDVAKVVYEENSLRSVFPAKTPPEGVPNASDRRIYAGTIEFFARDVVNRFITHQPVEE